MASIEEKYGGAELIYPPISGFEQILGCLCCGQIPDPKNYMQCKEKGHMICASCVISETEVESSEDISLGGCCALENLQRGHPRILQVMLDNSRWRCMNWETCPAKFLGKDWASHMRACGHHGLWHCQHFGCKRAYPSINELIKHYKDDHGADIFEPAGKGKNTFHIPVKDILGKDIDSEKGVRKLALLSFQGCLFIYAVELKDEMVHMWVWSVDNPIVKEMNDVEYSIKLMVRYGKDSGKRPKAYDRFKGIAKTYGKHLPKDMTEMRREPDQTTCAPSMYRHFIMEEEMFKTFSEMKEAEGVPLVMIALNECQELSLEDRIAQIKLK